MNTSTSHTCLIVALLSVHGAVGEAQTTNPPGPGFQRLGKIKPRAAKDITSSNWSIGGETLDRDFGVYANYKKFLGPLGAKAIRLQAGWAKCEQAPGVYDFAWLALVDFTFHASRFTTPVYADLRTGEVYSIPKAHASRVGDGVVLRQIPVYDSPILIAEQGVLSLEMTTAP